MEAFTWGTIAVLAITLASATLFDWLERKRP